MIAEVTSECDGVFLLGWLRLLGWRVEIERDGAHWTGIARRYDGYGEEHCVDGRADNHGDLVSELYHGALSGLALQAAA